MSDTNDVLQKLDQFNAEQLEAAEEPRVAGEPAVVSTTEEILVPEEPRNALEVLAPDEAICEGGPTRTQLEELKKSLAPGSMLIFTALSGNRGVVWKTVTRGEWKQLMNKVRDIQDEQRREDFIFSSIAVWPDCKSPAELDKMPAGAVTMVMQEFYLHSGFTPIMESVIL